MKNQNKTSRRSFLKAGLIVSSTLPLITSVITSKAHAESLPAVDPADPQPTALGYVHDASKVDTVKWPKKAGEDSDKQKCSTCILYLQGGLTAEGQTGEWGKCALFPTALVSAEGWCNSWALKG